MLMCSCTTGMVLIIQDCTHTFEGRTGFTVPLNSFGVYEIKLNLSLHINIAQISPLSATPLYRIKLDILQKILFAIFLRVI